MLPKLFLVGFLFIFLNLSFYALANSETLVPDFVTKVPKGYFAGVSPALSSLNTARKAAVDDIVWQILGAIDIQYDYRHKGKVTGDPRLPIWTIEDNLSAVSKGIVLGVAQNIVKQSWFQDGNGRYVFFVLVHYPWKLVKDMRRISKGAKIVATIERVEGDDLTLHIAEVNGVEVALTSVDITICKKNIFASFLSYYIWKVPYSTEQYFLRKLDPVRISGRTSVVNISFPEIKKTFLDYLLGSQVKIQARLNGYDEIGRQFTVEVN